MLRFLGIACYAVVVAFLTGCATSPALPVQKQAEAQAVLQRVKAEVAPDSHLELFTVGAALMGHSLVLTGEVQRAENRLKALEALRAKNIIAIDSIQVLPQPQLGDRAWAIAGLSLCNGREGTEHKAELGTQLLMGEVVRVLKRTTNVSLGWLYVQSRDGYSAWQAEGNLVRCTEAEARAWEAGPMAIITAFETTVFSKPSEKAEPLSDAVLLNKVRLLASEDSWLRVQLPDGRTGYVRSADAAEYKAWKNSRQPTAEHIEQTARQLLGRPYLWGANSPRGLDCSGFTKVVFGSNGIDLLRNAGHQATQGVEVPLDPDFSKLKKGDLIFFGRQAAEGKPRRVTHVGIYLKNKKFIHSADKVHISSLDPEASDRDVRRLHRVLSVRRILAE
jgi:cell wall-associated NlpC family hydrolase